MHPEGLGKERKGKFDVPFQSGISITYNERVVRKAEWSTMLLLGGKLGVMRSGDESKIIVAR